MKLISQAAIDLIVREEVSSRQVYEKKYQGVIWPGAASGITVGIGYDVGAGVSSVSQLRSDWQGLIPDDMIVTLSEGIGVTGSRAQALLPRMKSVKVPWDAAMAVFEKKTLPKYYNLAARLPNFDKLSLDCKGVLVSLVYNRGASFRNIGDRYKEMNAIWHHMETEQFHKIPGELRSMKRLWTLPGLIARREREAVMFEQGLKRPVVKGSKTTVGTIVAVGTATTAVVEKDNIQKGTINIGNVAGIAMITITVAVVAIVILRKFKKK